jgi:hypothetical protein
MVITDLSDQIALLPAYSDQVLPVNQFLLQQWRDIEGILVERGAHGSGITATL